ncbi:hypothetical protein BH09PAT3_BH09PAT3_5410 [soil metagenome]
MSEGLQDNGEYSKRTPDYYLGYFAGKICSRIFSLGDKASKRIAAAGPGGEDLIPRLVLATPLPDRQTPKYQLELDSLDLVLLDDVVYPKDLNPLIRDSRFKPEA